MNTDISSACQILLNLRKKYCVDSLSKFNKPTSFTISSDELPSSDDESSLVAGRKESPGSDNADKITSVVLNSDGADKKGNLTLEVCAELKVQDSKLTEDNHKKYVDLELTNYIEYASDSELSSIKTDVKDLISEVEDVSNESQSSPGNVLYNVHLVSDDILEDVESMIDSEDGARSRPSLLHTPKSINLGSPIEAPKSLLYEYESDFEYSDDESDYSDDQQEHNINKTINHNNTDEFQVDEPFIEHHSFDEMDIVASELLLSSPKTIEITNSHKAASQSSDTLNNSIDSYTPPMSVIKSKTVIEDSDIIDTIPSNLSDQKISPSLLSDTIKSVQSIASQRTDKRCVLKRDIGINVQLQNLFCKSVGVQTSDPVDIDNSVDDIIHSRLHPQGKRVHRRKVYSINTSVKSEQHRPKVSAGYKLSSSDGEHLLNNEYNPYRLIDEVSGEMSAERMINEMLRNQIAMTKHFINSHHRLYLQCCQTVKTMNKAYMKNKTHYIIS